MRWENGEMATVVLAKAQLGYCLIMIKPTFVSNVSYRILFMQQWNTIDLNNPKESLVSLSDSLNYLWQWFSNLSWGPPTSPSFNTPDSTHQLISGVCNTLNGCGLWERHIKYVVPGGAQDMFENHWSMIQEDIRYKIARWVIQLYKKTLKCILKETKSQLWETKLHLTFRQMTDSPNSKSHNCAEKPFFSLPFCQ